MKKITFKKIKSTLLLLLFSLSSFLSYGQGVTVSGIVYDADDNSTLMAVNVIEKGTTNGTITDSKGNFSISVANANSTLVFSFIGFETQEEALNGRLNLRVEMKMDISYIDEVVVVGYGTQRKSDLTGSVAVVNVKEMEKSSNSNMGTLLQGRVAGVSVTSDGQPGADPVIRIRGIGTFNNSDPLYVIDGVPVGGNPRDLSPNDIESMQILKDASAAAIYGSRAANGVIIITTKQGHKNTPLNVAYKGYFGFDDVYLRMPVLTRENYQTMYNRSLTNNLMPIRPGNDPASPVYIDNIDTDWQKEGFQTGKRTNHNLAMTGGGENGTHAIIFDYIDSKGTLVGYGPDYTRYSARANTTVDKDFFSAGVSMVYTHTDQNTLNNYAHSNFSGGNAPMVVTLTALIPTMPVYDETTPSGFGSYIPAIHGEDYSLNIIGVNNILEDKVTVDRMMANSYGILKLGEIIGLKDQSLDYKVNVSYDKTHVHDFLWIPAFQFSNFYTNNVATLQENWREYTTGLIENTLNYKGEFGKFKTDLLVGQMFQSESMYDLRGHGEGYSEPYYPKLTNATITSATSYEEHAFLSSYMGRMNLDYENRYLLTATIRRDATSRVSKEYRVGIFPSFSLGWKIHNESFFTVDKHIVSELKLRGGWGKLGNQSIGPYEYLAVLNRNQVYNFNNVMIQGSSEDDIFPNKLLWEEKIMSNIGADMSFLDRKIDLSVEYYNSFSDGILVDIQIPLTVGSIDNFIRANAAQILNSGFEFVLGYHERENEFKYDITLNGATLKNEVVSLGQDNQPRYGAASRTMEGEEVGRHYGYVYAGIFQTPEEVATSAFQTASTAAGDIKFSDLSGPDGVPDGFINDDDKTDLGSAIPNFTFGMNFSCNYKNIDFSVFANGALGYLIADNLYRQLMHSGGGLNWHEDILDSWTDTNTDTDIPRVVFQDPNGNGRDSNRPGWLQSGDHLKISNITLGYTIPRSVLKTTFKEARIYMSVQNIYTFTKYKGFNPDFATDNVWAPGFNFGSYPTPRTFMFGVNFNF